MGKEENSIIEIYTYKILFIIIILSITCSYVLYMNRYLRIRLESYYGKGGGLNHVKALVPDEEEHHILQRQVLATCTLFPVFLLSFLYSVFCSQRWR